MVPTVSKATYRKAQVIARTATLWNRGRYKQPMVGRFFLIPSGTDPDVAYYTSLDFCTCAGFDRNGICSHQVAVTISGREV